MNGLSLLLTTNVATTSAPAEDLPRLLVWVAVPAAILGAAAALAIKSAVLNGERFHSFRPGLRTFLWVAIADLIVWAVLWPTLLIIRIQVPSAPSALWLFALLMVVALGYLANRYGFARAFDPKVAGSLRGTLVAELFTILMPFLSVLFGLLIFWFLSALGV